MYSYIIKSIKGIYRKDYLNYSRVDFIIPQIMTTVTGCTYILFRTPRPRSHTICYEILENSHLLERNSVKSNSLVLFMIMDCMKLMILYYEAQLNLYHGISGCINLGTSLYCCAGIFLLNCNEL